MQQKDDLSTATLEFARFERISYHNAYVAFIDVLGFSTIVLNNQIERISLYHSIIKNVVHQKLIPPSELDLKFNFQVMSDSIVISIAPNGNSDRSSLVRAFSALAIAVSSLQFELAMNDLWVRGGVTYGEIAFLENNFVVGPALVYAYHLEDKKAKVPRVVIDPKAISMLQIDEKQFIREMTQKIDPEIITSLVLKKDFISNSKFDDYVFINYLHFFEQNWNLVVPAAENISRHLQKHLANGNEHREKYLWVADYIKSLQMPEAVKSHFVWLNNH